MKFLTFKRIGIFVLILVASILFGVIYDAAATAHEKKKYPIDSRYEAFVADAAEESGIPEPVLWAFCREESRFDSGLLSKDGNIGLLQISPEILTFVSTKLLETSYETGILYDPATNLRVGAAYLSYLYERYGNWSTVYAAYTAGTDAVDGWLRDESHVTATGELRRLPSSTASYVKRLTKATALYQKLYYR